MSLVPYSNAPSSYGYARRDNFFDYGNAMEAINSINGQRPTQMITTVTRGAVPPDFFIASAGGHFFDLRSPDEIFNDLDARLNRQRQTVMSSSQYQRMLQHH